MDLPVHLVDNSDVKNYHQSKWHVGIDHCIQVSVGAVVVRVEKITLGICHLNRKEPLWFKGDEEDDYDSTDNLSCFNFA